MLTPYVVLCYRFLLLAWRPPSGWVLGASQPQSRSGCHDFPGMRNGPGPGHELSSARLVAFTCMGGVSHLRIILESLYYEFLNNERHEFFEKSLILKSK